MSKLTMDEGQILQLADLIFAEVAEKLAEDVKNWQVTATYSPQEKDATRRILNNIHHTYAGAALIRRQRIPKDSKAPLLLDLVRRHSKGATF